MRKLATILIAATMLPVFGASPEEPQFSIAQPYGLDLALPGFSGKEILPPRIGTSVHTAGAPRGPRLPSKCYYVGQINRNLQKPKEKPELVPLADADVSPVPGNLNCLTRSLEPRATSR
jgi:hypothetical protein